MALTPIHKISVLALAGGLVAGLALLSGGTRAQEPAAPVPAPFPAMPVAPGPHGAFAPPPGGMGMPYWMQQDPAAGQNARTAAPATPPRYAPADGTLPQGRGYGQGVPPGFFPGFGQWGPMPWPPLAPAAQPPATGGQGPASAPPPQYGYGWQPVPFGMPQPWGWSPYPGWNGWPQQPVQGGGQ